MSAHRTAVQALQLRDWAAAVLLRGEALPPPVADAAAWRLFARMEWCLLALQRAGALTAPGPSARAAADSAVALESARVASAGELLHTLSDLAQRLDLQLLVLKGGAALAEGEAVHVEDVDVAVPTAAAAARLVHALDPAAEHGPWSLGQYRIPALAPQGAALEVHAEVRELPAAAPTMPLAGYRGLVRLAPREQLWHLLLHATATHPDRVARLRDLLLMRRSLAECADGDRAEVARRAAREPEAASLRAVLASARTGVLDPDLERFVRRRYFLLARWQRLGELRALRLLLTSAAELTAEPRTRVMRRLFEAPDRASVFPGMAALFRRAPRVDRGIRLALRPALLLGALALNLGAALEERA